MNKSWQILAFEEAISDESGGNIKTPQSEFLPAGKLPIVDQGKMLISGYVNDSMRACKAQLPVIIFGDHTRCFKFIDFPFGMGADGIKILRPRLNADEKYLFHYLRSLQLPNAGYDRHFKYLKRTKIPLPPIAEQKRIAAILDKAEEIRSQRRQALEQLDVIAQSIFLEMFGDPVTNPKVWQTKRCKNICHRITVGIVVQPASYYQDKGVPALRSLNIKEDSISLDNLVFFSQNDNETKLSKTRLKASDVVLVRTGQPGTAAVVPDNLDGVNAIDLLITTPRNDVVDSKYLCHFFNSLGGKKLVLSSQVGQIQKHLNVGILNEALIPLPPIALQQEFARRVETIAQLKATHRESLAQLDALFASLQHRAFRGEL
jgi:type I restriction enzyme, S subunit